MILHIAKKDFLLNLISARFFIGFLLCLLIIPFTVVVNVENYLSQVQVYKVEKEKAEKEFNEVRVWSFLRPTVVREPAVLSIFSNGISNNVGYSQRIHLGEYPLFPSQQVIANDNPFLNTFSSIDFFRVISILISLIALVFSYDAITREREDGTMRLTLTGEVSRITFLFGKLTGLLLTLLPILLFCYILACLIVMVNPEIGLSAKDWGSIVLLFLTSIVYMLVFILIGMFISALVSRSSTSIILSLLCWIWFLFLVPNISSYLAKNIVKTPLWVNVYSILKEFDDEYWDIMNEVRDKIAKELNLEDLNYWTKIDGGDGNYEIRGITKEMALYHQQLSIWEFSALQDYADKKWQYQKKYLDDLVYQQRCQQRISMLSPSEIFKQSTSSLCRTDMQSFLKYWESIRNYRETFFRYYTDKKIFESFSYFLIEQFEDLLEEKDLVDFEEIDDDEFERLLEEWEESSAWMDSAFLDLDDVPRHVSKITLSTVIKDAMGKLTMLFGLMVVLLMATVVAFMRYDVR